MFGRGQIIGRDEEQERLGGALRSAREHGELVLLAGDAGIGKSTLASAIAAEARREGRTVLEGRATPSEAPIALSIFRDALRNDRRHRTGDAMPGDPLAAAFVAHLLPELNRDHSDLGERDVLFEGATRLVAELAAPSGLAIVLEDLHWADGTSLDLILHLARTAAHLPLLQVATVRTDAGNAAPGVDRFRFERRRENLGEEIALDALDDAAARELVRLVAPDIPDDASATIRALAAGNPFVLEELGRDAAAGRAPSQGDLPWSVRHMLIDRLTLLEPAERDLIHWAAAAGYCFDLTLLQTAAGVDDDDFLTSLDRLRKAGIIEDDQCSLERMCFRYALTREAVLQELLGADRRRRAAGLLDAARRLAESGATLPLDALVGYAHDAGDHRSAFAYSTEAGHRSRALAGAAEALTHFRRALDTWVPALGDGTRAEALINLGRALMYTDPQSAIPVLGEARALFDSLGDRTNAAVTRASIASVRRTLGERDTALSELRRAAAELPADAPALARLRVADALASALMICGQGDDARTVATEALALVPESPSRDEAINAAHLWVSLGAVPMDDGSDVEALQRGRDLASAMSHPAGICRACLNLDNALRWFRARPEEAARMRAEGRAVAQENGMKSMECWLWEAEADALAERGDVTGAVDAIARAESLVAGYPREYESRVVVDIRRALIELMIAKPAAVEPRLRELWTQIRAVGHYEVGLITGAARAVALVAAGDTDGAADLLKDEFVPVAQATRSAPVWHALTLALGVAGAAGRDDVAAALPLPITPWSPTVGTSLATAFGALATDARPTADAISMNATSLDASGFHWHANLVRLLGAIGLGRVSRSDEAAELARAADEWFARIGAPAWSDAARGVLRRLGRRAPTRPNPAGGDLTAREREVLQLVAEGATNRQIAERLVISEPTAARHVANIFAKLRVNSRAEAVRVAGERDLIGHTAST